MIDCWSTLGARRLAVNSPDAESNVTPIDIQQREHPGITGNMPARETSFDLVTGE